jgi:hypothetical protein
MLIKIEINNLSLEDMALGILTSLRASARANYTTAIITRAIHLQATGASDKFELPPIESRRTLMKEAYAEVMDILPNDSPFREPMKQYLEAEIQNIRDR